MSMLPLIKIKHWADNSNFHKSHIDISSRLGTFFQPKSTDIFLIFPHKHMVWYSLEMPHWGTSNEYPQHMFPCKNKKNIMKLSPFIWSYALTIGLIKLKCIKDSVLPKIHRVPCHHKEQSIKLYQNYWIRIEETVLADNLYYQISCGIFSHSTYFGNKSSNWNRHVSISVRKMAQRL